MKNDHENYVLLSFKETGCPFYFDDLYDNTVFGGRHHSFGVMIDSYYEEYTVDQTYVCEGKYF